MPGPVIRNPLPEWFRPEAAAADPPKEWLRPDGQPASPDYWTRVLRRIGTLTGANDPQQVMAIAGAMTVPGGEASPVQAGLKYLEGKFPKLAGYIKAYHGSPHDFDKFSLDKIGTGEGAQAYGHGLYFAENPSVATEYKNTFTDQYPMRVGDKPVAIQAGTDEATAAGWVKMAHEQGVDNPLESAKNMALHGWDDAAKNQRVSAVIDSWIKQGVKVGPNQAKMYEVSIHAHPDAFLDYDKPVSQQGEAIRAKVTAAMDALQAAGTPVAEYHELIGTPHGSAALRQAGIPGIKYLDQGSRPMPYRGDPALVHAATSFKSSGQSAEQALAGMKQAYKGASPADIGAAVHEAFGENPAATRNFVVFDDSLIDIMRKYGVVLPLGAGLAALSQQGQATGAAK